MFYQPTNQSASLRKVQLYFLAYICVCVYEYIDRMQDRSDRIGLFLFIYPFAL